MFKNLQRLTQRNMNVEVYV